MVSQNKENSKDTYSYKFSAKYPINNSIEASKIISLHKKLKNSVGWKSFYRNGMLMEDDQIILWGNSYGKQDNKSVIDENKLKEFSNLKAKRFDMNYLSLYNIIFMNPISILHRLFGYNENRGGAVAVNFYPYNTEGLEEEKKGKYVMQIGASKKKHLEYTKKCLEDILGDRQLCVSLSEVI